MGNKSFIIVAIVLISVIVGSGQTFTQPLKAVESVDLMRYQGRWYEIAKYPNRFQKKCTGNTTATYRIESEDRMTVVNECRGADGKAISAAGEAKVVKGSAKSKLKVRFAPSFLSFLPFVWGDYWVIDLDAGYNYAAIGAPDRKYFWILSRTPSLDDPTYKAILSRAEALGFDRSKVVKTSQDAK